MSTFLLFKDTLWDPDPKSRKACARGLEQKYHGVADFSKQTKQFS